MSGGSRRSGALGAAAALALCLGASEARAAAAADSLAPFTWGANYRSQLSIVRSSEAFPWNDEEGASHWNDRLAVFGGLSPLPRLSLFLKGATGRRLAGSYRENRFMLDQGHAAFSIRGSSAAGRLFLRERLFRTNHRLMEIVSNESPFLEGRGGGLDLAARAGAFARMHYIETILRDPAEVERAGGLPLFSGGGDVFRMLRLEAGAAGVVRGGVLLSQVKSIEAGDDVTVAADIEARSGGIALVAELARSRSGSWGDLSNDSLFDLDFDGFDLDHPSEIFSGDNAFAAEITGLSLSAGRLGSAGVVPAYRFCGASFANPQGELVPGTDETSVIAWWRPRRSDLLATLEAADGSRRGVGYRTLAADVRARYRGGFELAGRFIASEGRRSSGLISFASETNLARTSLAARLDELGGLNELAFYAESSLNIARSVAAGGALYVFESSVSRYALRLEFRPRERFLLTIAGGSFSPGFEEIDLRRAGAAICLPEDRSLVIAGRVWLGGM